MHGIGRRYCHRYLPTCMRWRGQEGPGVFNRGAGGVLGGTQKADLRGGFFLSLFFCPTTIE